MKYIVGVDTGGTFTDAIVMTPSGELFFDKAPTTPQEFSIGIMDALGEVAKTMTTIIIPPEKIAKVDQYMNVEIVI